MGYDLRDALEYLTEMANDAREPHVVEIGGKTYCDKGMQRYAKEDLAGAIQVRSLKSLVEYINGKSEELRESMIVHVEGPGFVSLVSGLTKERERETLMFARAEDVGFQFDHYYDQERFIINMQTHFVQDENRDMLIRLIGTVTADQGVTLADDGMTQKVTARSGISLVQEVAVPNPVELAPFRTFTDVEQPVSPFVFRVRRDGDAIMAALFAADADAWKNEAICRIRDYFTMELPDEAMDNVIILA